MLKHLPIMLCRNARNRYIPIMLNICAYFAQFFFQIMLIKIFIANNSNFAMISVIQLVIINFINFILLFFLKSYDKILLIIKANELLFIIIIVHKLRLSVIPLCSNS